MISSQKRKRGPFRFSSLSDFLYLSNEFVEVQSVFTNSLLEGLILIRQPLKSSSNLSRTKVFICFYIISTNVFWNLTLPFWVTLGVKEGVTQLSRLTRYRAHRFCNTYIVYTPQSKVRLYIINRPFCVPPCVCAPSWIRLYE